MGKTEDINPSKIDIHYLRSLYDGLADSYNKQSDILRSLDKNVAKMGTTLNSFKGKNEEQDLRLNQHQDRIRQVERKQDSCDAGTHVENIWHHVKRFNAFKDMIVSKSNEDSSVIDLHAQRMQQAAEVVLSQHNSYRGMLIKMLPWFVVVFVFGVAMTTLVIFQAFSGEQVIDVSNLPRIESKTNSSSQPIKGRNDKR